MMNGPRRNKQPEVVRRALLDCTARLAAEHGIAAVTAQAVAAAAGVTKGGLFHHFPSKEKLIEAVFKDQIDQFDAAVESALIGDPYTDGCFTRAYVNVVVRLGDNPLMAQSLSVMNDPALRKLWSDWIRARLERHRETDSGAHLETVRYAADGIWLSDLWGVDTDLRSDREALRSRLLDATREKSVK